MDLSVVIPVCNEEESIGTLINEITHALDGQYQHEIIVIDDGSTDNTLEVLLKIKQDLSTLRIIKHLKNSGQSTAVRTGVQHAKSNWIATLDGDGQNDPADIPNLYSELVDNQNSDPWLVVAGYRKKRKDTWLKRISSKYANGIRDKLLRDGTPDTGCGLKIFARDSFLALPYFDHMHRYIPALFQRQGGRVVSVEVNHRYRMQGTSKYGFHNRLWVGIVDILGVRWLQNRARLTDTQEL
ncbi:glycosyltransferase family 2 protein [Candidatus Thioglobus sp.]|jgi:dolichol-phosphate mannosyltransferase|nr:glycosyltransferase family 2 protein [Candidatus Thioglobus sp.]